MTRTSGILSAFLAAALGILTPAAASAGENGGAITVVWAVFGADQSARPRDFTRRLQDVCGPSATSCETFCARASVGGGERGLHMPFSHRAICRVTYRCGNDFTRAAEAEENEMILLSCARRPGD